MFMMEDARFLPEYVYIYAAYKRIYAKYFNRIPEQGKIHTQTHKVKVQKSSGERQELKKVLPLKW